MNVIAGIVVDRVRVHRLDDGDVVDDLRGVRQQLAHPGPRLAVRANVNADFATGKSDCPIVWATRWPWRTESGICVPWNFARLGL